MNIEIKTYEDLEGNLQTAMSSDKMGIEELLKLGPILGRLITMNINNRTNMMALLKLIYVAAGWQIAHDTEAFISDVEEVLAWMLMESYVKEIKDEGNVNDILLP